jgi:hypothetical protein
MSFLKTEIIASALRIVEDAEKKRPVEDLFVELKSEWCDLSNVDALRGWARQLAGQANAARGESVLWIIGVKQRHGVYGDGAQDIELSDFIAQLRSCFSGEMPSVTDVAVPLGDGRRIMALHFATGSPPYVVKDEPRKKDSKLEVPWRDSTGTRSATRNELIQMLEPLTRTPEIDLLEGNVHLRYNQHERNFLLKVEVRIFVAAGAGESVTLPTHRASAFLAWNNSDFEYELVTKKFFMIGREPKNTVSISDDVAVIHYPSTVAFEAFCYSSSNDIPVDSNPVVRIEFLTLPAAVPIRLEFTPERESVKPGSGEGMPSIVEAKFTTRRSSAQPSAVRFRGRQR